MRDHHYGYLHQRPRICVLGRQGRNRTVPTCQHPLPNDWQRTINWRMGINVVFSLASICLSQTPYLERVLDRFGMKECRLVTTWLKNQALTIYKGDVVETRKFHALIRSQMYVAGQTLPMQSSTWSSLPHNQVRITGSQPNKYSYIFKEQPNYDSPTLSHPLPQ